MVTLLSPEKLCPGLHSQQQPGVARHDVPLCPPCLQGLPGRKVEYYSDMKESVNYEFLTAIPNPRTGHPRTGGIKMGHRENVSEKQQSRAERCVN